VRATEPAECRAGDVLRGNLKPVQCPAFGKLCTPDHPLGAPMVSAEGACAAYYNYGRFRAGALPMVAAVEEAS
jgi:hydrogenase expression/formation protein HypD